jgi:ribonuclease R
VVSITPRASLEAHRLIEEMMVQANVCAAETLEAKRTPLIYRVHDTPSDEKMTALADFLSTVGLSWTKGQAPNTERFNALLDEARDTPNSEIVNEVVLRTQMQAHYNPENIGHFGLNLDRYAHFTSPIRRYADLVVHRALIGRWAWATTACRTRTSRACPRRPTTSPPPNAAPWPPNATRPTATSRPSCRTG